VLQLKAKLDKRTIDGAAPRGAGAYFLWDGELPGFGVRVDPTGGRVFVVRYLAEGGGRGAPQRQKTLGRYGELTLAQARELARDVRAEVRQGGDPVADRKAKRGEMTIAEAVDFYEKEGCVVQRGIRQGEPMKPLTKQYTMARLRNHVVPLIGNRRITEIEEGDIQTLARQIKQGKTARDEKVGPRKRIIVRGGDGAARKVVRDVSALFSFLLTHKKKTGMTHNPVEHAAVRKTDNKRERFLAIEEVKRLGTSLEELEGEGVNRKAVEIARGWALTGCRRNEIAGLKKKEIDLERGLLIFDDTKTGRSVRPIGAAAVALFAALLARAEEEGCESDYLFPAERGDGFFQGTRRVWVEAIKRAKLPGITPHTLRHTLGGFGGSSGEALLMIGAVLGHSNARSTSIYAHVSHDPARLAADRMTAPIAEALGATR
jgi:integrase